MLHEKVQRLFLRTLDLGLRILRKALQIHLRAIVLALELKAAIPAQDGFGLREPRLKSLDLLPALVNLRTLPGAELIQFGVRRLAFPRERRNPLEIEEADARA
jgi:hypothetical protein